LQQPKAVRVNVMLPENVLQAIDRTTANRSRFLADAARESCERAEVACCREASPDFCAAALGQSPSG
jgi:metal-responsive CopG/Arc/MetJ family transcriptional regulator